MGDNSVSKATLGRLPQYLEYLRGLSMLKTTISSTAIARDLSLGDVQVRKDLAQVSGRGRPRVGYDKEKLIHDIERYLGHHGTTYAVLVGAGKLSRALMDFGGFEEYGIKILAAFDCNEEPISIGRSKKPVLPIRNLRGFCAEHDVCIGIITTGQGSAQEVFDMMVDCGIKAVWNFAPVTLKGTSKVAIKQVNLALSLAHLNNQIVK